MKRRRILILKKHKNGVCDVCDHQLMPLKYFDDCTATNEVFDENGDLRRLYYCKRCETVFAKGACSDEKQ